MINITEKKANCTQSFGRRGIALILVLLCAVLQTAPVMAKTPDGAYTTVSVKKNKTYSETIDLNEKLTIIVKNGKKELPSKSVTYKSSKKDVASVNKKGVVTPKKEGKTVITVKYGKKTAKLKLTVTAGGPMDSGAPGVSVGQNPDSSETVTGQAIADYACSWVGITPYAWGGNSLTDGTDCAGFIHLIYANFGISVPRSVAALTDVGYEVPYSEAKPGDIIAYDGFAAIYLGDGAIVACFDASNGTKIRYDATFRPIISCRRVIPDTANSDNTNE